jgi:hypothetical protein
VRRARWVCIGFCLGQCVAACGVHACSVVTRVVELSICILQIPCVFSFTGVNSWRGCGKFGNVGVLVVAPQSATSTGIRWQISGRTRIT